MKLNKLFVKASVIMKINSNLKKIATAGIALLIIICAFTPVVSSQVEKSSTIWNIFEETTENTYSNEHPMSGNRVHSLLNTFVWIILNLINNIGNKPLVTILYNALTRLSTENNEINDIDPNTNINNNKLSTKKMITTPNPPKPLADDWNVTLDFNEPDGSYDNAMFGEKPNASDGLDSYDVPKSPPGIPPYIRAWFATNFSDPYDELWEEYKHYPDDYKVWNLTVQWVPSDYSSPTTVNISWNPDYVNNSEYSSVVLYDVGNSVEVSDMLVDTNYTFTCPALALQNFKIICSTITNQPPVANDDAATVDEDSSNNQIDVLANDTDPDGDTLTIDSVTNPSNGSASTNGSYVYYTPNSNYNGLDSFTYTIDDGNGGSDSATVNITINPQNDPPVANDDSYSVDEDTLLSVPVPGVLSNDYDNESDPLTAVLDVGPSNAFSFTLNSDGSFNYTPNPNYNGADSFTYVANDGTIDSNVATVTITVNPINDSPVAVDDSYSLDEGGTLNVAASGVLGNDYDNESDPLTAVLDVGPSNAFSFTLNSDGSFDYVHDDSETTSDSFTYHANDGSANSNVATVTITVNPQNDPPVAVDDSYSVDEDTLLSVPVPGVLSNDYDNESDPLTAVLDVGPSYASSFTLNSDGSFNYTPNPNYNGDDLFTYHANDGTTDSNIATVTITINPQNDPPQANDDYVTVSEDSTNNLIDALANDYDIDLDDLNITGISAPSNGNATYTSNYINYTPNPDYSGSDQFNYTITDNNGGFDNATIYITVNPINDPPVANNDPVSVLEDSTNNQIDVLTNDNDPDGDSLSITNVTIPIHGTTSHNASYVFYTPIANYTGSDQFSYTISDGNGGTDNATVYVTVGGTNDPPTANDDLDNVNEDTANNIIDVLANDYDPDGDDLEIISVTQPSHGVALFTSDYVYYTPESNYSGLDQLTYMITDSNGGNDNATVFIIVNNVNDPPVANDDSATVDEDSTANQIDVLANDVDIDGDILSIVNVTLPDHGNASINGTNIIYTPDSNYSGSDQFEYNISDGNGAFDTAIVTITVNAVNDPPVANDDNATVNEDSIDNIILVLNNDLDIDGDTLSIINVSTPMHGTTTYTASFVYYTPSPDYNGLDQFNYMITDNNNETDNATVYINVTGADDPPNANADSFTVFEDSLNNELDVLANDNDPEGDVLTIIAMTQPTNGVATFTSNYVYYTPDPDFVGDDAFTYTISDGNGGNDSAPILINVTEANDPPYMPSDPNPQNESTDVPFNASLSWNCSDPDNDPVIYDVYFGTNSSPPMVTGNLSNSTYNPGMFDNETTYYWKIIAKDNHSAQTEGPLWHFTTAQNHPPFPPRNPNPDDGAIMVDPDIILSWTGDDPDPGDIVTYDVYLSENSPPWQVVSNQSENTYDPPGVLKNYTTYYWKIVSWDYHGASIEGPIWEFSTGNLTNKPPTKPIISGPKVAGPNVLINFSALSTDEEGNQISYMWDWGDGNFSDWLGPHESGEIATTNYTWTKGGNHTIKVKAKDSQHEESYWSEMHNVSIARQITIINPQLGFLYFQLGLMNNSYFYSNLLNILGITAFISLQGFVLVETETTDAVHSVKIEAYNLISGDSMIEIDNNGSDGFEAVLEDVNQGLLFGYFDLSAHAYDEDGNLIDTYIIKMIYLDFTSSN